MMSQWLEVLEKLNNNEQAVCPICKSEDLEYRQVLVDDVDRVGFVAIWCNECKRGYHISRVIFAEDAKNITKAEDVSMPEGIKFE